MKKREKDDGRERANGIVAAAAAAAGADSSIGSVGVIALALAVSSANLLLSLRLPYTRLAASDWPNKSQSHRRRGGGRRDNQVFINAARLSRCGLTPIASLFTISVSDCITKKTTTRAKPPNTQDVYSIRPPYSATIYRHRRVRAPFSPEENVRHYVLVTM